MKQIASARSKTFKQQGFTLVEIAIVLVIVGLLLGGVMKGQELITSAKVRSLVSKQQAVNMAWFSFQDRYQAKPGDFQQANLQLGAPAASNGTGDGFVSLGESDNVWQHLALAGFITGTFPGNSTPTAIHLCGTACMPNGFDSYMNLAYIGAGSAAAPLKHRLYTGLLPAVIAQEVDIKLDDGMPNTGSIRNYVGITGGGACVNVGANPSYALQAAGSPVDNCSLTNSNF